VRLSFSVVTEVGQHVNMMRRSGSGPCRCSSIAVRVRAPELGAWADRGPTFRRKVDSCIVTVRIDVYE